MNSCFFKLYCNYSNTLTLSNLGELSLKLKLCSELPGQKKCKNRRKTTCLCTVFKLFWRDFIPHNLRSFPSTAYCVFGCIYMVCGYMGVVPDTEFGAKNKPSKIAKNFGWLKRMKCV